ncbi:vacuolar protein sorting-associated protein 35 [Trypanosoma grayi]|uniref:vacuolar protein sorting-associated protein 35 n=1 Tax=Trypanosoma grayi TaxID=71804 RepID=UPI0004F483AC|nr:vacuolar protein sorting-associated protein 35 [Trypanosoma grayi]KEG11920.1 vacuolar protein sorting-associated protein 35 [Trypanosoma grayi]
MVTPGVVTETNVISIDGPILTPKQEQEKWLGEAVQAVREHAASMQAHMRQREFINVLRSASHMLAELRTGMLAPQNYYELYVKVFDEMQQLEQYIEEEYRRGRPLEEMYEVAQHAGCIVPRLYLLITVGAVYIKSGEQPALEILHDLLEMCKGVQHPTRGLFLRHFLLSMMKNRLPGDSNRVVADSVEGDGGTVEDTAELLLQNFKEMNWLWIRMEAKGPARTESQSVVQRKHRDRKELCVLVGMNIVRISQLEGVERQVYKSNILPRLLSIIVKYRESLAQQYLLEVIVQVFPDEFHLFTLDDLLGALEHVSPSVDVCAILASLMERLGNYATALRDGVAEAGSRKEEKQLHKMFDTFKARLDAMLCGRDARPRIAPTTNNNSTNNSHSSAVNSNSGNNNSSTSRSGGNLNFMLPSYVKSMLCLVELSLKTDPVAAVAQIGVVLGSIAERMTSPPRDVVVKTVERMIAYVIKTLKDPSVVLTVENLDVLTQKLPFASRREVSLTLCTTIVQLAPSRRIATLELAARLFELIVPLVRDEPDAPRRRGDGHDTAVEFLEEQHLVCRVLHLLQCDDLAMQMKMLNGVRKQLGQGGPERVVVTLPTLASLYMRLALRVKAAAAGQDEADGGDGAAATADGLSCAKPFHFIHSGDGKGILEMLAGEVPQQTFHLYLAAANAADVCGLADVAYEHYVSAFQIYEECAADTREQIEMMGCMISSLYGLRAMPEESYELLATKVCQYSSKLVRKSDQSHVVSLCAHLFWKSALSDESHHRVLECLQRALKIANHAQPAQQLPLFVELLNQMLHYYAGRAPGVTVKYITTLIDLVEDASSKAAEEDRNNDMYSGGGGSSNENGDGENNSYESARRFYRNTARYIRSRQQVDERWGAIGEDHESEGDAADAAAAGEG